MTVTSITFHAFLGFHLSYTLTFPSHRLRSNVTNQLSTVREKHCHTNNYLKEIGRNRDRTTDPPDRQSCTLKAQNSSSRLLSFVNNVFLFFDCGLCSPARF